MQLNGIIGKLDPSAGGIWGEHLPIAQDFWEYFPFSFCGILLFHGQNLAGNEDRASQGLHTREKQGLGSLALPKEWNPGDFPSPLEYPNSPFSLSWTPPFPAIIPLEGWECLGKPSVHYKEQIGFLSIPIPLLLIPSSQQGR